MKSESANANGAARPDAWTFELLRVMKGIALEAAARGSRYLIGGGLAIDLSFGAITRAHDDIDMICDESDAKQWQRWFATQGLLIERDEYMAFFPLAFSAQSARGRVVAEVYPMKFNRDGSLTPTVLADHPGREWWVVTSWKRAEKVEWEGLTVCVENSSDILRKKLEHVRFHRENLEHKHLHDVKLLGKEQDYLKLLQDLELYAELKSPYC